MYPKAPQRGVVLRQRVAGGALQTDPAKQRQEPKRWALALGCVDCLLAGQRTGPAPGLADTSVQTGRQAWVQPKMQSVAMARPIAQRLALATVEPVGVALAQAGANRIPVPAALAPGIAHARAVVDRMARTSPRSNGRPFAVAISVGVSASRPAAQRTTRATARTPCMART